MINRRNRQFRRHSKTIYLSIPRKTLLERAAGSGGGHTGVLDRRFRFAAVEARRDSGSLEQRQRMMVWWFMALLWILFFLAGIILWNKASSALEWTGTVEVRLQRNVPSRLLGK